MRGRRAAMIVLFVPWCAMWLCELILKPEHKSDAWQRWKNMWRGSEEVEPDCVEGEIK